MELKLHYTAALKKKKYSDQMQTGKRLQSYT